MPTPLVELVWSPVKAWPFSRVSVRRPHVNTECSTDITCPYQLWTHSYILSHWPPKPGLIRSQNQVVCQVGVNVEYCHIYYVKKLFSLSGRITLLGNNSLLSQAESHQRQPDPSPEVATSGNYPLSPLSLSTIFFPKLLISSLRHVLLHVVS